MAKFEKGNPGGGRHKGSRNKLHADFIRALADDFETYGDAAIKLARMEDPAQYLRLIASVLPKEFVVE